MVSARNTISNYLLQTTFKILPLKCYDAILGMNWLEKFSPMEIQWAHKWLSFWHEGSKVKLQGLQNSCNQCLSISLDQLPLHVQDEIWCMVQVYNVDC